MRDPSARSRGRNTWQRRAVVRAMEASGCHLTAEEIYRLVRRQGRPIGLATVYRTLESSVRAGLVEPVHFGDGPVRYGLASAHHDHRVCLGCGAWEPLDDCLMPRLPRRAASDFRVTGHRLELYGYCPACQAPAEAAMSAPDARSRRA